MNAGACGEHGGPAGEELRLLALALLDKLEPGLRSVLAGFHVDAGAAGRGAAGEAAAGADAGGARAPACQWCPLCSLIAVLRGDHPELGGRLAEHAAALLTALRALLESRPATVSPEPTGGAEPTGDPAASPANPASRASRVQHIRVHRDAHPDRGTGGGC